jgi:hypothetical protein
VSEFSSGGTAKSGTGGYSNGGLGPDTCLAVDGLGSVWAVNASTDSLSRLSDSGTLLSGSTGYTPGLDNPNSLAFDGSGNVWITDFNDNRLIEVVGAAAPVVTPLVTAAKNNTIALRP